MAKRSKYAVSFYFELSFKGEDSAFQEVSGISKELVVEEVIGGGENRFKYRLPKISTHQNLVLKRALVPDGTELIDWCANTIDTGMVDSIETHDVSLSLLNTSGDVSVMWTFFKAYPVKYVVSDLKSTENSIVIETIELAYTYFEISPKLDIADLFF